MIDFQKDAEFFNRLNSPPDAFKQWLIGYYQKKFGYHTLVETGTYKGEMIKANLHNFTKIISVELGDALYADNVEKFKHYAHVELLHGDSGKLMPVILDKIHEPTVFYLDAHAFDWGTVRGDKDSPILEELDVIIKNFKYPHVIVIDDARLCERYMGNVNEVLNGLLDKYSITVDDDSIRLISK